MNKSSLIFQYNAKCRVEKAATDFADIVQKMKNDLRNHVGNSKLFEREPDLRLLFSMDF